MKTKISTFILIFSLSGSNEVFAEKKEEDRIRFYADLVKQGQQGLLESILKLRLAVEKMSPEERLRTQLLIAYSMARRQDWQTANHWVEQAQIYMDHSFQARSLKKNPFYQSEIDMTRWDIKEMEKR